MDVRNSCLIFLTSVVLVLGFVVSDLEQDRAECANQLIALSTCLPYVGGDAKLPTKDCCAGFKQVLDKTQKCICILIKDRNDPNLGLKINATLAVNLPVVCHQPAPNITRCISLLHLSPNSPEAKDFERLGKIEGNSTAPPSQGGTSAEPASAGASASEKSDGGEKMRVRTGVRFVIYGALTISCSFTSYILRL